MDIDLFATIPVKDYAAALPWYELLLGGPPTFVATDTEAVWELGEHRWVVVEQRPVQAGHGVLTILVPDLDAHLAEIAGRGLEPSSWEANLPDGMRKALFLDADGNEFGIGGAPG
jgi:predicted enzyme related to lactoylglutathione lyase